MDHSQILKFASAAESGGFDGFFRSDHYLMNYGSGPRPEGGSDAWITLAALARETIRMRLGTLVTPITFRHPGPLAVTIAQVDAMSDGRLELGLGSGWFEREHSAMGIPFPGTRERSEQLEEFLEILNIWWSTPFGESFTYLGNHYRLLDNPALPKPRQLRVPIIIGGWSPTRAPRLAARFADEYNLAFGALEDIRPQFDRVKRECETIRRDPTEIRWSAEITVCCGESEVELIRRAERARWEPSRLKSLPGRFIGSPEQLLDRLVQLHYAGVDTVYFQLIDVEDTDHIALLSEQVLQQAETLK